MLQLRPAGGLHVAFGALATVSGGRIWQLYLDETGEISRPEERVVLGGLVLPGRPTREMRRTLRQRIEEATAGIPYPPHATSLWMPAYLVVGAALGHPGASDAARAIAGRLLRREPAMYDSLVARPGDWGVIDHVDRWLEKEKSSELVALQMERRRIDGELLHVLESCARAGGFAVAAVDPVGQTNERNERRYLRLFGLLLERLARVLPSGATLVIHAAEYGKVDASSLGEVARRHAALQCFVPVPAAYREDVEPGVVLADYVMNRGGLRTQWGSWSDRRRKMLDACGLPVEYRGLPTVCVEGPPRAAIERAERGESRRWVLEDLRVAPGIREWERQQAELVVESIGSAP